MAWLKASWVDAFCYCSLCHFGGAPKLSWKDIEAGAMDGAVEGTLHVSIGLNHLGCLSCVPMLNGGYGEWCN